MFTRSRIIFIDGDFHLGVLTKPDTILIGEEDSWLRVLEGSSHPLKRTSRL